MGASPDVRFAAAFLPSTCGRDALVARVCASPREPSPEISQRGNRNRRIPAIAKSGIGHLESVNWKIGTNLLNFKMPDSQCPISRFLESPRQRLRINQVFHGFDAPKDWPDTAFPINERSESMGLPAEMPSPVAEKTRRESKKLRAPASLCFRAQARKKAALLISIHFGPFRDDFAAAPRGHFPSVFRVSFPPHSLSLSLLPPNAAAIPLAPLVAALCRVGKGGRWGQAEKR
jgi:hypothetical protein